MEWKEMEGRKGKGTTPFVSFPTTELTMQCVRLDKTVFNQENNHLPRLEKPGKVKNCHFAPRIFEFEKSTTKYFALWNSIMKSKKD